MALTCVKCKMLCAVFLLISIFTPILSTKDKYLFYDVSPSDLNSIPLSFSFLRNQNEYEHTIEKRDATTKPEPIESSTSKQTESDHVTPVNSLPEPSITPGTKNLGVNGTGTRKNVTITIDNVMKNNTKLQPTAITVTVSTTNVPDAVPKRNRTESKENDDGDGDDEFEFTNFSDEAVNKTLQQNNITKTEFDSHTFYNSSLTIDPDEAHKYWLDMTNRTDVKVNELLSQSHRRAATMRLSFDFPFYGHIVRNITIATGGFLYTGEYVHSWLAATQYIAPLMANFDTSLSNESYIKYVDQNDSFTVQWEKVSLQDKPNDGNFTFQTTLFKNGDIVFVYKHIPIVIESIQDNHHPVKIGLSDAYISDRTIFFVRRKTIYEYHRVNFDRDDIKNETVIYLKSLPTCLSNTDCISCVSKPTSSFTCAWCPGTNRCSNGMDRYRQDWLMRGCEHKKIRNETMCSLVDAGTVDLTNVTAADEASSHYDSVVEPSLNVRDDPKQAPVVHRIDLSDSEKPVRMGVSGIIAVLFLVTLIVGMGVWVLYAYRNPHSASGQILIRYRPSQWSWKRGEARYTAATIHM